MGHYFLRAIHPNYGLKSHIISQVVKRSKYSYTPEDVVNQADVPPVGVSRCCIWNSYDTR